MKECANTDDSSEVGQGFRHILWTAGKRALNGGIPGLIAMVFQVILLMWLRTTVNYQYKNGGTLYEAMTMLYAAGGIARFYMGIEWALIVGPLSRFGDTAANEGGLTLFAGLPITVATALVSCLAASWRIVIHPIQNIKTVLQTDGVAGWTILANKIDSTGYISLWDGALGNSAATWMGHFPSFTVWNYLDRVIPKQDLTFIQTLCRNAGIGFCSSFVADCVSNSMRVITIAKSTSVTDISYSEAAFGVIEVDGLWGLLGRGLGAKILCNGISAMLFSVLWKYLQDRMGKSESPPNKKKQA
jgi:hypothetical protein